MSASDVAAAPRTLRLISSAWAVATRPLPRKTAAATDMRALFAIRTPSELRDLARGHGQKRKAGREALIDARRCRIPAFLVFSSREVSLLSPADVTQLLRSWQHGDADALERLLPVVYDHLHRLAHARLRGNTPARHSRPPRSSTRRTSGSWMALTFPGRIARTSSRSAPA
jgi:ECF sigma factor